jgi:oxygen-independent coproporphyrinogen-3 oxidase
VSAFTIKDNHAGSTAEGTYFVSNYPPYEAWTPAGADVALEGLSARPDPGRDLGLYVHVPFCRKRCRFCYFKVYTGKNSQDVSDYIAGVAAEAELLAAQRSVAGRAPRFLYVGGGTPSYMSERHTEALLEALTPLTGGGAPPAFTFECEPGTLSRGKLETLKRLGVTRLSFGVEHLDDAMLLANGRAHDRAQVLATYELALDVGFPQINVDLLAGLSGETEEGWLRCVEETLTLEPDSVTIYQLELPANTPFVRETDIEDGRFADWPTKRRWLRQGFETLESGGYTLTSAYTAVRDVEKARFPYRDHVWRGDDLLGLGVSAFSHMGGRHHQNEKRLEAYLGRLHKGELPLHRGHALSAEERHVREIVLGLKHGALDLAAVAERHEVEAGAQVRGGIAQLVERGLATREDDRVVLTPEGRLEIDRWLPLLFDPIYGSGR